uniref:Uncharacterized protein n=1 Tax=Pygocentrus nattereri TaxID=42514 RepID=A0AAR2LH02_PYGNA
FLGGELIDIHADLPLVLALLHISQASTELAGQRACKWVLGEESSVHHGAWGTEITCPVASGPTEELLRQDWHPEGLVKDPAAVLPVMERIPARLAQRCEGNLSLSHSIGWSYF